LKRAFLLNSYAISAGIVIASVAVLMGCKSSETEVDQLASIRAKVDGTPRCASLIARSWPVEFSEEALSGRRVDALVAAGLIRRAPLVVAQGDRARTRIELTPLGQAHVLIERPDPSGPGYAVLCYGKRQVISVHSEQRNVGAETGSPKMGNVVVYKYRIVEPPSWAARDDVRSAFPFMVRDMEQLHSANEYASLDKEPSSGEFFSPDK
jgi:hypothetical protein